MLAVEWSKVDTASPFSALTGDRLAESAEPLEMVEPDDEDEEGNDDELL